MIARSFRDLKVYQHAEEVTKKVFLLSRNFPPEERSSLTDQIRRSSRAVKAMIAEAWGRRRSKAVFINKLDEALGESTEIQSWLDDARNSAYFSPSDYDELNSKCVESGRMLSRMIDRADDFCKHPAATDYRTGPPVEEDESIGKDGGAADEFFA